MKSLSRRSSVCLSALVLLGTGFSFQAFAAVSAQITGRGGLVGEYFSDMPPSGEHYQGFRFPMSFGLEARPSNNLRLVGELYFSMVTSSSVGNKSLGNTNGVERTNNNGSEVAQPLTQGNNTKFDGVYAGVAYMEWSTEYALIRAGRMPRHWGLGIWRNADWDVNTPSVSTSDAVGATIDMSAFNVSLYWEKNSEGSPLSRQDDADGISAEVTIQDDPSDTSSSGLSRKFGLAFANYDHKQSSTKLLILDMFAQLHTGPFAGEGEVFFPSGNTKSPNYSVLGGNPYYCDQDKFEAGQGGDSVRNPDQNFETCDSQKVEGFATLWKFRFQVGGAPTAGNNTSLLANDMARYRLVPTSLRNESHTLGAWFGYVRGDKDAFGNTISKTADDSDDRVRGVMINGNVRPALLMYNPNGVSVPGMPGAGMTNTLFIRGEYVYESPTIGTIVPAVVWGQLTTKNPDADGFGAESGLGFEVDCAYNYLRVDNMNMGLEAGLWFPGKAWESKTSGAPGSVFGLRATLSTKF